MERYNGQAIVKFDGANGNAAVGVEVTVIDNSTGAAATLYATNNTGGATISNPLTTDSDGRYYFYAGDGNYTLSFSSGDPDIVISLFDPYSIANYDFDTILDAQAYGSALPGMSANIKERTAGNGGGAVWDYVLASTVTPNTFNIVTCTGVPTLALVLRSTGINLPSMWGAGVGGDDALVIAEMLGSVDVILDKFYTMKSTQTLPSNTSIFGLSLNNSGFIADLPGDADPGGFSGALFTSTGQAESDITMKNFTVKHSATTNIKTDLISTTLVTDITLSDIRATTFRHLSISNSSNIKLYNLFRYPIDHRFDDGFEDGGAIASIRACSNIRINNIHGDGVAELVDFGIADDIVMTNISSKAVTGSTNEAIDLGGIQNAVISSFNFAGGKRGILIKLENEIKCDNIRISDGVIREFTDTGLTIDSRGRFPTISDTPEITNVTISNVTCESTLDDTTGFSVVNSEQTSGSEGVIISNCKGKCTYSALVIRACTNFIAEACEFTTLPMPVFDIVSFSDAGGGLTTVTTSTPHGYTELTNVSISGTTSYNGTRTAVNVTTTTFDIGVVFVTDEATGDVTKPNLDTINIKDSATGSAIAKDIRITNCIIDGTFLGSNLAPIKSQSVIRPTFNGNKITSNSGNRGIYTIATKSPKLLDNEFFDCLRFIDMFWDDEASLVDTGSLLTEIEIRGNKGKNFVDYGLIIQWALTPASAYTGAIINDNTFLNDTLVGTGGIIFGITNQSLDITSVNNNVLIAANPVLNGSRLGPNSTINNAQNP